MDTNLPLPYLPTDKSCVAHYTTLETLDSILSDSAVSLWATRYGFFEDKNEYVWAMEHLLPHLPEIALQNVLDYDSSEVAHPYILSLTKGIDNEFMWKEYGSNFHGVMLVFDRISLYHHCNNYIESTGRFRCCSDVLYASESDDILATCFQKFKELRSDFCESNPMDNLVEVPVFIKEKDKYHKENEFRISEFSYQSSISAPNGHGDVIFTDFEDTPKNLKFRNRSQNNQPESIIPYINFNIPKECLVAIVLGNQVDTPDNRKAIELLLRSKGYSAGIFKSRIQN